MALTDKKTRQSLTKKRDKVYDQLLFNREYPAALATRLDKENEKKLEKAEFHSKKRLLPLEIAASSQRDVNSWRLEQALAKYVAKHELKRRELEQTYLRAAEKDGQAQATAERDKQLAQLDKAFAEDKKKLEQKYPLNTQVQASGEAVLSYTAAAKSAAEKLESQKAQLADEKQKKLDTLAAKLDAQNQKLQVVFDDANKKLRAGSKVNPKDFGDDTILRLQNIKMHFGSVKAVDDVSFDIKEGEIFGLIGPNGAGKSTIFNCITQFYRPTAGNVYYQDRFGNIIDLTDYKTHDIVSTGIARTFQNLELVHGIPVMGNLLIGAHIFYRANLFDQFLHTKALKNEEAINRARAMDIMERLGLTKYRDLPPEGLSYGILKKIELARTLMTQPRLIILDEPAAGLNETETQELAEIIRQIRKDFNCTIFLVEHDMGLVMSVCDTVCATSFGKLLAKGTPKEIQRNPLVQEAYLGVKEDDD